MKKIYNKPTLTEVKLQANQAIATCSLNGYGYQLSDKWTDKFYSTEQEALSAQPDQASSTANIVFPVYTYNYEINHDGWVEKGSGMWADTNKNKQMDDTDIVYNQQGNRPNIHNLANVFAS